MALPGEQFLGLLNYLRQNHNASVRCLYNDLGMRDFYAFDASDVVLVLMTQEITSI